MTNKELANLLDELIVKYSRENRHLEFKSNYQDANSLGEYISALSNGATLDNEDHRTRSRSILSSRRSGLERKMFVETNQDLQAWIKHGEEIRGKLVPDKFRIAAKYPPESFGIIVYIESLFSKWYPYDNIEWIYGFTNISRPLVFINNEVQDYCIALS